MKWKLNCRTPSANDNLIAIGARNDLLGASGTLISMNFLFWMCRLWILIGHIILAKECGLGEVWETLNAYQWEHLTNSSSFNAGIMASEALRCEQNSNITFELHVESRFLRPISKSSGISKLNIEESLDSTRFRS